MEHTRRYSIAALAACVALAVAMPSATAAQESAQPRQQPSALQTAEQDAELEAQVKAIASKLRCPTCRALSVQDSPAGMAQEMRALIREQLKAGKTPEEITAYFVDRYGEWILLKPKAQGFNWTVWLLPILMLAGGLFFVFLTARRWVQQGQAKALTEGEESER